MSDNNIEEKAKKKTAVGPAAGGIQSLHRALAIIQEVADQRDGVGLVELSNAVGLHRSTAFHLAKTLVSLGLLRQEGGDKRYRVGTRLFSLASGSLDEIEILELATPILARLASQAKASSHIAVRTGVENDVVIIGRCEAPTTIQLIERVGATRPAYATAIGKVLLAALPSEQWETAVEQMDMKAITAKTITSKKQFLKEVDKVHKAGFAFDEGEFDIDVNCLAAPVFDFRGRVIAAIGISSPAWSLEEKHLGNISQIVTGLAEELSTMLGGSHRLQERAD